MQRLALRDQAIVAYIATAGAYYGFVLDGAAPRPSQTVSLGAQAALIIVLPVLSLVFTYIILQHHAMIGKLGEFTRSIVESDHVHWDGFYAEWSDKSYLSARTSAQALLLILPVAYTAVFAARALATASTLSTWAIVASVLIFDLVVFAMILRVHLWAYSLRRSTDYIAKRPPR